MGSLLPREVSTFLAMSIVSGAYSGSARMNELTLQTGLGKITLNRAIKGLEEKGMVQLEERPKGGPGAKITFTINESYVGFNHE